MKSHGFWLHFRMTCRTLMTSACLAIAAWLVMASLVFADDEYNFNWLDPDKKITVLQNRKYRKVGRPAASIMTGFAISETYRNTTNLDVRGSYSFTEDIAIEAFYAKYFNRENNAGKALSESSATAIPVIREVRSVMGGLVKWSPWYAKINVFNTILYFDWYITGGLGLINTAVDQNTVLGAASNFLDEEKTAFFVGTGHQYHITRRFLVRLDFMGAFFRAPAFGLTGGDTWFSNFNFNFGVGVRL